MPRYFELWRASIAFRGIKTEGINMTNQKRENTATSQWEVVSCRLHEAREMRVKSCSWLFERVAEVFKSNHRKPIKKDHNQWITCDAQRSCSIKGFRWLCVQFTLILLNCFRGVNQFRCIDFGLYWFEFSFLHLSFCLYSCQEKSKLP